MRRESCRHNIELENPLASASPALAGASWRKKQSDDPNRALLLRNRFRRFHSAAARELKMSLDYPLRRRFRQQLERRCRHQGLSHRRSKPAGKYSCQRRGFFRERPSSAYLAAARKPRQLALAYVFRKGDFRSGYYRDQTIMFALDLLTVEQFFAQLYAHADPVAEPSSAGRSMTSHFATRFLDAEGRFESQVDRYNSSADLSPTGAQMPRLVGLAYASKLYRQVRSFDQFAGKFSDRGNEIAFGTIGNASCAEGIFWESVNAAGVLQIPMLLSIWDDGFGISVPNSFQMTKGDISRILEGFQQREGGRPGLSIYVARGWNYSELCSTYLEASEIVRRDHTPAMIHVTEMTQPQGHSTSGNHERYKSPGRLAWEREYDCLVKMREWILEAGFASERELDAIETSERDRAVEARDKAWRAYRTPIEEERRKAVSLIGTIENGATAKDRIAHLRQSLEEDDMPLRPGHHGGGG